MSTILIVEDNEKNLKLVRDVLQVKGYQTLEAGTAEDGIRIAAERAPDLVLMDIQLPGMNGMPWPWTSVGAPPTPRSRPTPPGVKGRETLWPS